MENLAVLHSFVGTGPINMPAVKWAWAVPPYVIGSLAIYWVIERIAAF